MSLLMIALGLGVIAWIDVPQLIHEEQWKTLAVYAGLWLVAAVWAFVIAFGVPMPIVGSYIAIVTHGIVGLFTGGGTGGS